MAKTRVITKVGAFPDKEHRLKISALLLVVVATVGAPAQAIVIIPPGSSCPRNALCKAAEQLVTVPAFFDLNAHTSPGRDTDWNRIKNAGNWVKIVVAGDAFASKTGTGLTAAQTQFAAHAGQAIYG